MKKYRFLKHKRQRGTEKKDLIFFITPATKFALAICTLNFITVVTVKDLSPLESRTRVRTSEDLVLQVGMTWKYCSWSSLYLSMYHFIHAPQQCFRVISAAYRNTVCGLAY